MQPRLVLNSQSFSLSDPELRITGMRHHTQLESFYPYISFKGCWLEWYRGHLIPAPLCLITKTQTQEEAHWKLRVRTVLFECIVHGDILSAQTDRNRAGSWYWLFWSVLSQAN